MSTRFQFHNGSIKRNSVNSWQQSRLQFQFHNGSIKSARAELRDRNTVLCFNSTMVRLKAGKNGSGND